MELKRALELRTEYAGQSGVIRVDGNDYICLNEMAVFFPSKRLDHWLNNGSTIEFIELVERNIIPGKSGIIAKRGKGGGTWAHHLIAFEFATWLSPEFKLKVYQDYIEGTQDKKGWNIKRIMAADNFKFMTDKIRDDHAEPKPHHFSNEARMINTILFNEPTFDRDNGSRQDLENISWAEKANGVMIQMGIDYQTRKVKLAEMFEKMQSTKIKELENGN